jgi:hypothetical protein
MLTPTEFIEGAVYRKGSVLDGIRNVPSGRDVDCDDFAWSLLVILEGGIVGSIKALIRGKATLWRVRSPVNKAVARHVALVWQDSWIDSTRREWRKKPAPHVPVRKMKLITLLPMIAWGHPLGKVAGLLGAAFWARQSGLLGLIEFLVS